MVTGGLKAGPDGWLIAPEGAVIDPESRSAVIADLHLGYEWTRGKRGDQIPAHSLREVLERLERLLARMEIDRLIVAGDLVESPQICARTNADLQTFRRWLESRNVTLIALPGNHDPKPRKGTARNLEINGWTIAHGDQVVIALRKITGHEHPIFHFGTVRSRCLLVSDEAIILPAFSENAAGLNVASDPIPKNWRERGFRCLVEAGNELLDFGQVDSLVDRLNGRSSLLTPDEAATAR